MIDVLAMALAAVAMEYRQSSRPLARLKAGIALVARTSSHPTGADTDVVDIDGIRNRHHAGDRQRKRLIICAPIEGVGEAELFQHALVSNVSVRARQPLI